MKVFSHNKTMKNQKKAFMFILPSFAILTLFVFIPLFGAFAVSLMNIDIFMQDVSFAGLKNYIRILEDERVGNATYNTFRFALIEVPLQIGLAILILMFMLKNTKVHKLLRTVFYIPYVCSMTAISIMWSMLLNTNYGMLPYILSKLGITMPNLLADTRYAMPTVILVTVWKGFGYTLTLLSAAALGVSESLYEAAELDGASSIQKFFHVTIPEIKGTIGFCSVTTLIQALQVFDQIYVMTDGGPLYSTETLVGYIYNKGFQTAPFDLGYSSAIAIYLFVMIAALTFVLRKYAFGGEED